MYEKIDTFDRRASLPSWLYRIVVNTALMQLRTKARRPEELSASLESAFTADGRHARQVNAWALPPEETLLRREALAHLEEQHDAVDQAYSCSGWCGSGRRHGH